MPRTMWSGSISFGLVNVPVRLYPAQRSHRPSFRQVHRDTHNRVRQQRVDAETGEEVAYDDIVKGYEIADGRYVTLEPEELDALGPRGSREISILDFVELTDIDPLYFDRSYYLAPSGQEAAKAFVLLRDAMQRSGRAGIARFVMRGNEYLAAVRAHEEVLVATTLRYADEVLEAGEIETPDLDVEVGDRELAMAEQLIGSLESAWDPEAYEDEHQTRVMELIQAKAEGGSLAVVEDEEEDGEVIDLMAALERSLEQGRAGASAAGEQRGLEELSKSELYDLAQERDVPGRSQMSKEQLVEALQATEAA